MTFCLGITVEEGLVGIADTRVLSGHESLTAKKVATYEGPGFSFFIMTSGLRSLRDKVLLCFEESYAKQTQVRDRLFKVVNLYASQVRRVAEEDGPALQAAEFRFNIHSLVGGQMAGDTSHRLFLVYPEGNWVEIGPDTSYQIIGNSGFGKPILERSLPIPIRFCMHLSWAFWLSTRPGCARPMWISRWICCSIRAAVSRWWSIATSATTCATFPTGGRSECAPP